MSVIAVHRIPNKYSLTEVVKFLVKPINGQFEALNFKTSKGQGYGTKGTKTCYLRLSEKLDPVFIVEKINRSPYFTQKSGKWVAEIPEHMPDISLSKTRKIPAKLRRALHIPIDLTTDQGFVSTHYEIMFEMQSKYAGLHDLSRKTGHKLLEEIAKKVFERLKHIMDTNEEAGQSMLMLSKCYRKMHPHFGDFQLLLSTLHALEDAQGEPRSQISEADLTTVSSHPYVVDNIPYNRVKQAYTKYSDKVVKKILEHIGNFKCEFSDADTEEDVARKRVRQELKKLTPYIPTMVNQVSAKYLTPQKREMLKLRIYGEPFLPSRDQLESLLKRHRATRVFRSERMYNLIRFNVPPEQYTSLMAMDGTVIGGAKLVIRPSIMPLYEIPKSMIADMKASLGSVDPQLDLEDYPMSEQDTLEEL